MRLFKLLPLMLLCTLFIGGVAITNAQTDRDTNGVVWNSTFYNNSYLGEPAVLSRTDSSVAFNWGAGSPSPVVNEDYFSARFTTSFSFTEDYYRFRVGADDGVRVIIDNSITLIDTFDNPQPSEIIIADAQFSAGVHTIQVDYREITGLAQLQLGWVPISNPGATVFIPPASVGATTTTTSALSPITDWVASYYSNPSLSGSPSAIISETDVSHDWGVGAPLTNMPTDNFSVRWGGTFYLDGTYEIAVRSDDGVRVYVDGQLYIDEWHSATLETYRARFSVPAGNHTITVEYYEEGGVAFIDYDLRPISTPGSVVNPQPQVVNARDWLVQYYTNAGLAGEPVLVQSEDRVSRTWGTGAPTSTISPDNFSVRFISNPELEAGTYQLRVRADDGVRVYVDDILYIDEWRLSNGSEVYTANVTVEAGIHIITIEYYESTESAFIEYSLDPVSTSIIPTTVASAEAATATVIASRLNVRAEPSVFAPILTKVSRGETYQIVGQNPSGSWIQLNVNGTIGWVNETYTDEFNYQDIPVVDETVVDVPDVGSYTAATTANLNMRRGPGLEYDVIRIIPENTVVSIEARTIDADWWQVLYRGQLGWVTEAFVNVSPGVIVDDVFVINP